MYDQLRAEVMELCPPGEGLPERKRVRDFIYRQPKPYLLPVSLLIPFPAVRAVLNETLPIFPAVPINTRHSTTESAYPPAASPSPTSPSTPASSPPHYTTPLYMPPRSSISVLPLLMQRGTDLWGPDAENFRPLWWLPTEHGGDGVTEAGGGTAKKRPERFVPFSAGSHLVSRSVTSVSLSVEFSCRVVSRAELCVCGGDLFSYSACAEGLCFFSGAGMSAPRDAPAR